MAYKWDDDHQQCLWSCVLWDCRSHYENSIFFNISVNFLLLFGWTNTKTTFRLINDNNSCLWFWFVVFVVYKYILWAPSISIIHLYQFLLLTLSLIINKSKLFSNYDHEIEFQNSEKKLREKETENEKNNVNNEKWIRAFSGSINGKPLT